MLNNKHSIEHHEHHPKRIEEIDEPDTDGSEQRRFGRHHVLKDHRVINEHLHALFSLISEGEKKRKLDQHPKDGPPAKKIKLSDLISLANERPASETLPTTEATNVPLIIDNNTPTTNTPSTPTKRSSVHTITNHQSSDSPLDKFRSSSVIKQQDLDAYRVLESAYLKESTSKSDQVLQFQYAHRMYEAGIQMAHIDKLQASVFLCEAFMSDERVFVLNPLVVATFQAVAPIKPLESGVLRAAISLAQGEFTEAIVSLTGLLRLLTDRKSRLYQLRAACYLALGNYFFCLRDLKSSLSHNPNNHQVHFMRAQVFLAMGQWESAYQSSLNFVVKAHPDDTNLHVVYYNLTALALKLGKGEDLGQAFYRSAITAEARYIELNNGQAMTPIPDIKKAVLAHYENDFNYTEYKQFFKLQETKRVDVVTGLCYQCGRSDTKLFVCAGCTTIQYCSKGCQHNHWAKHKQDCGKLKQINE